MLSTAEIRDHLAKIEYRPGWSFTAYDDEFEGQKIRILAKGLLDSERPGETIDLGVDSFLPPVESVEGLDRWLVWRLTRIESHEVREWFRVDGRVVWNPHERQG